MWITEKCLQFFIPPCMYTCFSFPRMPKQMIMNHVAKKQ